MYMSIYDIASISNMQSPKITARVIIILHNSSFGVRLNANVK